MSDKTLKQESERWLVYTRLTQYGYSEQNWVTDRRFDTLEDAEAFLEGPSHDWPDSAKRREDGWRGPIKAEALSTGAESFSGPWLRDALKISKSDKIETYDQMYEAWWESTGADAVPYVMAQMDSEGLLEKTDDLTGHPAYTDEQRKQVQLRAGKYKRPEIECFLDSGWNFFEIRTNAKRRLGHVNPDEETGYEHRLFAAALDLEAALREQYARLTAIDIFHFWTSFDVWVDLAAFCRKTLWNGHEDQLRIEAARQRFCRFLGSYAHSICSERGHRLVEHSTTEEGAFSTNGSGDPGHAQSSLSDASQEYASPRLSTGALDARETVAAADSSELVATPNSSPQGSDTGRRRGRRPNPERREAIRSAIDKHGDQWRDHLSDIFGDLDSQGVHLGDFLGIRIDLDDGQSTNVSKWDDLELAVGDQRRQVVDALRKYLD
jgi:hypothetical protein